jgi:Helix-turn-helix domain
MGQPSVAATGNASTSPDRVSEPAVYTVDEAAHMLRVGRSLAYALARRYLDSGGREGLPVLRVGNCLRVPAWALQEFLQTGHIVVLIATSTSAVEPTHPTPGDNEAECDSQGFARRTRARVDVRARASEQLVLDVH